MALSITTVALPEAQNGVPYNVQMQASGGTPPYSEWSLAGISPNGYWLSITPEGQLVGTPGLIGPEEITIDLYDSATPPNYAQTTLYLTVLPAPAPATPFGIIPAYLYQQYAGDENLQALFAAYNAIAQYYLDWFISTPLGYYPGLSGDLLDWVAEGAYGTERTALSSPASFALGPIASLTLASEPFAYFSPPTSTFYSLTDDAFQRILTWNLYKGDGNRFSMRWLKRRIMRFLIGVNGIDPQPYQAGFVIGCENTQAISATVADNVLTVEINQALLSSLVQITPGILQIFQLAFQAGQAGPLGLPLQYESYVCNIITSLSAYVSPTSLAISGAATTQTTDDATVTVLGGSGSYTYAWSWLTGGTGLAINSDSANATGFTGAGMSAGHTYTGTAQCLVTDTITSDTTTCQVTVSIQCWAALSANITPSSVSVTGASATEGTAQVVVGISGGSGSYGVSWDFSAGGAGISINNPSGVSTNFTGTGIAPGETLSGTAQCTVTDLVTGEQAFPTCGVSIYRVTEVSASVSPSTASSSGVATTQTTNAVTASGSGGSGSYTFNWVWISGGGGLTIGSPASASTTFTGAGMVNGNTYTGTAQCTVTDGYVQRAYVEVSVTVTCTDLGSAVIKAGVQSEEYYSLYGYQPSVSLGSLVSNSIPIGTLSQFVTEIVPSTSQTTTFSITAASNPGAGYFTTLTVPGIGSLASSAATYSYSGGVAQWVWASSAFLGGVTNGTNYSVNLT